MARAGELTHNPILTDIAQEYVNEDLMAEKLIDVIPTDSVSFRYYKFAASAAFDVYDDNADEDADVPESKSKRTPVDGSVKDHALRESIGAKTQQEAQLVGWDERAAVTQMVQEHIKLNHEMRVASIITNTANFAAANVCEVGVTAGSAAKWDTNTGDPFKDLMTYIDKLIGVGVGSVRIGFGLVAWRNLSLNEKVRDAIKYTGKGGVIPVEPVKEILGVDEIFIGRARKNTTNKINASETDMTLARIWGDNVVIVVQPKPGMASKRKPAFAYTFRQRVKGSTSPVYTYTTGSRGGHGSEWVQVACDDQTYITGQLYGALLHHTST